jgi:hypothetical protein
MFDHPTSQASDSPFTCQPSATASEFPDHHFIGTRFTGFPLHRSSSYYLRSQNSTLADQEILSQLQSITLALNKLVKTQQNDQEAIRELQQKLDYAHISAGPGPSSHFSSHSQPPPSTLASKDFTDADLPKLREIVDSWRDKRSKKEGGVFLQILANVEDPEVVRSLVSQQFRLLAKTEVLGWAQTTNPSLQILSLSSEEHAAMLQGSGPKMYPANMATYPGAGGMVPPSRSAFAAPLYAPPGPSSRNFSGGNYRSNYPTNDNQPPRYDGAGRPIRDPAVYMAAVQRNRARSRDNRC